MKPNHIIWSGCSFTFGSGFISEDDQDMKSEDDKPKFIAIKGKVDPLKLNEKECMAIINKGKK